MMWIQLLIKISQYADSGLPSTSHMAITTASVTRCLDKFSLWMKRNQVFKTKLKHMLKVKESVLGTLWP